jgi:hypothetical protein
MTAMFWILMATGLAIFSIRSKIGSDPITPQKRRLFVIGAILSLVLAFRYLI